MKRSVAREGADSNSLVCDRIREAISIGVPLYNAGDPSACAQVNTCSPNYPSSPALLLHSIPTYHVRAYALTYLPHFVLTGVRAKLDRLIRAHAHTHIIPLVATGV